VQRVSYDIDGSQDTISIFIYFAATQPGIHPLQRLRRACAAVMRYWRQRWHKSCEQAAVRVRQVG